MESAELGCAQAVEFIGTLVIMLAVARTLWMLLHRAPLAAARHALASGAVTGLGFTLAGTLLKTLALRQWEGFAMLAAVYAIRWMLKKSFALEA